MGFYYSITETFLHSIWQSLLLVCFYTGISQLLNKTHPLQKRNLLYTLLVTQFFISIVTFSIYFNNESIRRLVNFTALFSPDTSFSFFLQNNAGFIFCIYCSILFIKFFTVFFQWKNFKNQYYKQLIRPDASLKVFAALTAHQLGIKRKVSVWYSNNVSAPITFGFIKPVILLPFSLINNLSILETEAIILHELAHIKSKDYLLNWFLMVVEVIYFFNPFVKILAHKIRIEREKNCDVQVINFNYEPLFYAQVLLKIAKTNNEVKVFQLGAVKKGTHLLNRIHFFSDGRNMEFKKRHSAVLGYVLIPIIFALSVCLIPTKKKTTTTNAIATTIEFDNEKMANFKVADINTNTITVNKLSSTKRTYRNKKSVKATSVDKTPEDDYEQNESIYKTVAINETPDSIKEIIYNIETQHGKITKSYKLTMTKGQWTVEPLWILVEKNADTIFNKIDSSFINQKPIQ